MQAEESRAWTSSSVRPPVCVLGMHRSGTSLTTRALNVLGVELGNEEEILKPLAENPTGFWENESIIDLNEDILATLDRNHPAAWRFPPPLPEGWQRDPKLARHRRAARLILRRNFAGQPHWGWKDPRSCLTLPFWQELIPAMRYVICVRDPGDVAASLDAREGIPRNEGARLWLRYMSQAVIHTAGHRRLFVSYEGYFPDWERQVARLARFLQLPVSDEQLAAIADHLDERLWHQRGASSEGAETELLPEATELFSLLSAACSTEAETDVEPRLDAVARKVAIHAVAGRFAGDATG